jgi:hypothetical protein
MKPIQKDELYKHLSHFLKSKGVELKEGSYTKGIHAGCSLLADAINLSQTGFERAKAGLDKKIGEVRQVIHQKTAPRPTAPPSAGTSSASPQKTKNGASKPAARKAASRKKPRSGKRGH